ncbi:energy-coupling factor transporter transmembrane component T family protein [Marinococcus luteus]|uniref:energy-coupling factor transporter transmembrane component T family protein n=1 Tax=Marinococcus luteus TaxID=1122204 RepID=UPI002ACC7989|nr:energy-coupling factor transporter transmembrane component T [Marinococcus luteus]MDZ5784561.1 energy-coupling factor transporter transmembrane component T [Marinococcus luteus]
MLEKLQTRNAFLQHVHPTLKLLSLFTVFFCMIFVYDIWRPLAVLLLTVAAVAFLGKVPLKLLLVLMLPFGLFGFSFIWLQVVFPDERGSTVLFYVFQMPVALENIQTGISLGLRAMVFASWSLLFVLTTSPVNLVISLIQKWHMPPNIGYGMMAAYRFLPQLREELTVIRRARQIRGMGKKPKMREWKEMAVPLMAGAVRKAERTALAMESKGFDGSRERTEYVQMNYKKTDIWFSAGFILFMTFVFLLPMS